MSRAAPKKKIVSLNKAVAAAAPTPVPVPVSAPVAAAAPAVAAAAPAAAASAAVNLSAHTILFYHSNPEDAKTKWWKDFDGVDKAMDGVCGLFEEKLKTDNPNKKKITYDISDLFAFVDQLPDLAALVFDERTAQYAPFGKAWIKESVFAHLKRAAQG